MNRVEIAEGKKNYRYRPTNYGPYLQVPLRFRELPEFRNILDSLIKWMRLYEKSSSSFYRYASELFNVIAGVIDYEVISLLNEWIVRTSTPIGFKIISHILSKASNT